MKKSYINYALLLTVFCLLGTVGLAQDKYKDKDKSSKDKYYGNYEYEFCGSDSWSNGDKVTAKDLRETNLSAGDVNVDSKNGRITIIGENRGDVLVRACVKSWAKSKADAQAMVDSINVNTSGTITANFAKNSNSSVSYEIHVPNSTNLDLSSNNGRITISDVDGQIKFKTRNGRVTLNSLSGDVQGETNNGRVTVKLAGVAWQGSGLNVKTKNGRISLYMPSSYAGNFEVGTNNGRFSSDFEELNIPRDENGKRRRYGGNKVNASVNGGGAPIRVVTNNGRVSIKTN